jgi:hypothetical protein
VKGNSVLTVVLVWQGVGLWCLGKRQIRGSARAVYERGGVASLVDQMFVPSWLRCPFIIGG